MKGFLSSYYVHFKICVNSQGEFSLPSPTDGMYTFHSQGEEPQEPFYLPGYNQLVASQQINFNLERISSAREQKCNHSVWYLLRFWDDLVPRSHRVTVTEITTAQPWRVRVRDQFWDYIQFLEFQERQDERDIYPLRNSIMSQTITWFICDSRPAYSQDQQCSRHLRVNKLTF